MPSAHKHRTAIFIQFFSRFPIFNKIRLTFYDSTNLYRFNLNHFTDSNQHFLIWLNFSYSIKFSISDSIWIDFLIWFNYNYINLNHPFQFDSYFLYNLTHHLRFNSTCHLQLILNQLSHFIWHVLHTFESLCPTWLSYSDSIWLRISDLIWLSFLIWFD